MLTTIATAVAVSFKQRILAATLAAVAILAVAPQDALAGPAEDCRATQLKAAGKACSAILKCYGKGATGAVLVDPACTTDATDRLTSSFGTVEGKLACAVAGKGSDLGAFLLGALDEIAAPDLAYVTGGSCASKKLKAAAKKCAAVFKCYAAAAKVFTPFRPDPNCLDTASGKFGGAFTKIEGKETCTPSGNVTAVETAIDELSDQIGCDLSGFQCGPNGNCTIEPYSSVACTCDSGYTYDGATCTDIDECALDSVTIGCGGATCTNTTGSFECACITGYAGDGHTCYDHLQCPCWRSYTSVNALAATLNTIPVGGCQNRCRFGSCCGSLRGFGVEHDHVDRRPIADRAAPSFRV